MRRVALLLSLAAFAAGCASSERYYEKNVVRMAPGYGVMVATFQYVPGKSAFPQAQVLSDARYAADRLAALGYESFVVYSGGNTARVGVRAATHAIAETRRDELNRIGHIRLGDGNTIPVTGAEIANIAELKLRAVEFAP